MSISKHTSSKSSQCDNENVIPSDLGSDISQPEIAAYIKCPSNSHIFGTQWIPTFPIKFIVVAATPSKSYGSIQIYKLNNEQLDVEKVVEKKAAFRCSTFNAFVRNTSIALGNFHGGLQIFDVERFDFPIYNVNAHNGIVNCLDGIGGENGAAEIVTGGDDGCIRIWDPRQRSAVVSISAVSEKDNGNGPRDCWSVTVADGFSREDCDVYAGFDNGDIKAIDLRMMKERWGFNVGSGICKVSCDRNYEKTNKLVAGTVNGSIHVFDMEDKEFDNKCGAYSHKQIAEEPSSPSAIWSISHLPQDDTIFAACSGGSVEIWQQHPSPSRSNQREDEHIRLLTKTNLSSQPINCFDWNPHFRGLGLCASFDQTIHVLVTVDV